MNKPIALVTDMTYIIQRIKHVFAEQIGRSKSLECPPQIEMMKQSQFETTLRHIWFHHPLSISNFYHIIFKIKNHITAGQTTNDPYIYNV